MGVPFKVSFASATDETAVLADLVLPDRHFLESWGDASFQDGQWTLQQPAMQPVPHFDGRQTGDLILSLASRMGLDLGGDETFYDRLRTRWQGLATEAGAIDFESFWHEALRSGVAQVGATVASRPESLRQPDRGLVFDLPSFDAMLNLLHHAISRRHVLDHSQMTMNPLRFLLGSARASVEARAPPVGSRCCVRGAG